MDTAHQSEKTVAVTVKRRLLTLGLPGLKLSLPIDFRLLHRIVRGQRILT